MTRLFTFFKWAKLGLFFVYYLPFLNTMTNTYSTKFEYKWN